MDLNKTMNEMNVDLSSVVLISDVTEMLLKNFSRAILIDYPAYRTQVEDSVMGVSVDRFDCKLYRNIC